MMMRHRTNKLLVLGAIQDSLMIAIANVAVVVVLVGIVITSVIGAIILCCQWNYCHVSCDEPNGRNEPKRILKNLRVLLLLLQYKRLYRL